MKEAGKLTSDKIAFLSNCGEFTIFSYLNSVIKFRTSRHLLRYTKILEWNNGYLVVMAKYDNSPAEEEEYIDLIPILKNLYFDSDKFLKNISEVKISYD